MHRTFPTRSRDTKINGTSNLTEVRTGTNTHDKLLVPQRLWEVAVERHPEVVRVVALIRDDVLEQRGLMTQDFRKPGAVGVHKGDGRIVS